MKDDRGRLEDILEAINAIERHAPADYVALSADELVQVWIVHYLQVIGEASNRLSDELRQQHPEVPWNDMIGLRHVIVHGYDVLELPRIWSIVASEVPTLKSQVVSIFRTLDE